MKLILVVITTIFVKTSFQEITDEPWDVSNCPSTCDCLMKYSDRFQSNLRTVDCNDRNLFDFPSNLPLETQNLILSNNKIRRVLIRQQNLQNLVRLDLSHNLISTIDFDRQYQELYSLKSVDLSFNRLDRLSDLTFRHLFNLEDLDLSDNIISLITHEAFGGLMKLETLRLSGNRLSYLQNFWWIHLKTLYNLYLDRNRFTLVQGESFKSLDNLLLLDLSRNKIYRVNDNAFVGLDNLESLSFESNFLIVAPRECLRQLKSLKSVNFGRNAFFKLRTDDFSNLHSLKDINLSNMPRLRLIERGAFKNLPELLVLEIHDNPYLGYIDRSAFVNTPQITHVLLHNNNLTVLERQTVDSLPSLEEVSFYGNPLSCDCNSRWLNKFLTDPTVGERKIVFREAERMVCDGPQEHKFKLFATLRPSDMPRQCAPKILFMFDSSNVRKVGDDITYDCRAVGVPEPRITWVSPEGEVMNPTSYHPRRILVNSDTLVMRHVKIEDAGLYACIAENEAGHAVVQTYLNVSSMQIELAVQKTSGSSVTVSWNGPDRESNIFQLLYRPLEPNSRHQYAATVTPIMKTYTIPNLQPSAPYEVCIAFEDDDNVVVHISCVQFVTKSFDVSYSSLERTSNVAVGAALGIVACVLIIICLLAVLFKRKQDSANQSLDPISLETGLYLNSSTDSLSYDSSIYAPLLIGKSVLLVAESRSKIAINV